PYDVLEDDTRDWKKASRKLLSKSLTVRIQKQLKTNNEQVNWDLVTSLSHDPRGIPVPITLANSSLDTVLAAATKVQNHVPEGSTWDGKSDLPMDEGTFRQMMADVDPNSPDAAKATPAPATTPAGGATAPAPGTLGAVSTPPARGTAKSKAASGSNSATSAPGATGASGNAGSSSASPVSGATPQASGLGSTPSTSESGSAIHN